MTGGLWKRLTRGSLFDPEHPMPPGPMGTFIGIGLLVALAVLITVPMYWMVTTALTPTGLTAKFPPDLFPANPTLRNLQEIVERRHFWNWVLNSTYMSLVITVATVLLGSMAGYAFARLPLALQVPWALWAGAVAINLTVWVLVGLGALAALAILSVIAAVALDIERFNPFGASSGIRVRTWLSALAMLVAAPPSSAQEKIKVGLLEDISGDLAMMGMPKLHGSQLAAVRAVQRNRAKNAELDKMLGEPSASKRAPSGLEGRIVKTRTAREATGTRFSR